MLGSNEEKSKLDKSRKTSSSVMMELSLPVHRRTDKISCFFRTEFASFDSCVVVNGLAVKRHLIIYKQ